MEMDYVTLRLCQPDREWLPRAAHSAISRSPLGVQPPTGFSTATHSSAAPPSLCLPSHPPPRSTSPIPSHNSVQPCSASRGALCDGVLRVSDFFRSPTPNLKVSSLSSPCHHLRQSLFIPLCISYISLRGLFLSKVYHVGG